MPEETAVVKEGKDTTELAETQASGRWAIVMRIAGIVMAVAGYAQGFLGEENIWAIVAGIVLAVAGDIKDGLVKMKYIKSRTDVKTAAAKVTE